MGVVAKFVKDPDAVLDYSLDWSLWLATGDAVSTATWTVPTGLTKNSQAESSTATTVWLSGGTADTDYDVKCKITTTGGRTDERTFRVKIRNL